MPFYWTVSFCINNWWMTLFLVGLVESLFVFLSYRFFAVNFAIVYFYFSIFQRVNEEEFGGVSEIMKEGLMTSFATFIVRICCTVQVVSAYL